MGSAGNCKSSIVKQIAQENDLIYRFASGFDGSDRLKRHSFMTKSPTAHSGRRLHFYRVRERRSFLDASLILPFPAVSSAYQRILDRRVGEYELPEGWAIVAAGNREGDRGVTYRMPAPFGKSFCAF